MIFQTYKQECGICSIKNLLKLYKMDISCVDDYIQYNKNGNSIEEIVSCLKKYFNNVIAVNIKLEEFLKINKIDPFILLIKKDNELHYVVIYKIRKRMFYVCDSSCNKKYKIKYNELKKISTEMAVLVESKKEKYNVKKENKIKVKLKPYTYIVPIITMLESTIIIMSNIYLQQLIDGNQRNGVGYVIFQICIIILLLFKTNSFFKIYKKIDNDLIIHTLNLIYNLSNEYTTNHDKNEIVYRMHDVYKLKQMITSFIFEFSGNIVMIILCFLIILSYHFYLLLFMIILIIPMGIYIYKNYKKSQYLSEKNRTNEYNFFENFKEDFKTSRTKYNMSYPNLVNYQNSSIKLAKNNVCKSIYTYVFQTLFVCMLTLIYTFKIIDGFTIGKFLICINIFSLLLQPLIEILSNINLFSEYKFIKKRLNDLINHSKINKKD